MTLQESNAAVVYRYDYTPQLMMLRVALEDGELPDFAPGQYAELAIPECQKDPTAKLIRRSYSIASAPQTKDYYEFYITLVEGGVLTPALHALPVGGRLWLGPKVKGKFTLENVPENKHLILISTGTGIAPFISMLRAHAHNPPWKTCSVIHGVRHTEELGYRIDLENWQAESDSLFYLPTVTRSDTWSGHRGRVHTLFEDGTFQSTTGINISPEDCQVMLCGNPAMIDSLQHYLEEKGLRMHRVRDPGQIHYERYW